MDRLPGERSALSALKIRLLACRHGVVELVFVFEQISEHGLVVRVVGLEIAHEVMPEFGLFFHRLGACHLAQNPAFGGEILLQALEKLLDVERGQNVGKFSKNNVPHMGKPLSARHLRALADGALVIHLVLVFEQIVENGLEVRVVGMKVAHEIGLEFTHLMASGHCDVLYAGNSR